ncbi:MAG: GNAT family N-acetyltransferase [Verrucomicrobiota bacterium]
METESLTLRPYEPEDRDQFLALVSNPDLMARVGGPVPLQNAVDLFDRLVAHDLNEAELAWAIILRHESTFIGHVVLQKRHTDVIPQIGFVLHAEHWGRGFATEAAFAVLQHALADLGHDLIEASVDPDHTASKRVLHKIGMRLAREESDEDGAYLVYSIDRL